MDYRVTEFLGDGIGTELSEVIHSLVDAFPFAIEFEQIDLSLENRKKKGKQVYDEAMESIRSTGVALKHPTATELESPNQMLRKLCNFTVIHRPVITIPGVESNFKGTVNLDIIRVATGGTYQDPGQQVGNDVAVSLRIIERQTVRSAADYAFKLAKRLGTHVTSSSKWTIQRATDGLFEDIVKDIATQNEDVPHHRELFDALLAKIIMKPEDFRVIITLNEYGDFLSDMACGLVGSLGIGASGSFSFTPDESVELAMFDAAHGTAPDIAGKGVVNPTAIMLAFSQLLAHLGERTLASMLELSILDALKDGHTTADLGGNLSTSEFTENVKDAFFTRLESMFSRGGKSTA
jgi:isocitrate dehydrogenase (NAD+)